MSHGFLKSSSLPSLWMDALVRDDKDNLLFMSAWGSESAIQHARARFSLPVSESGLRRFQIDSGAHRWAFDWVSVNQPERYEQVTGRPSGQSRFLHLTHLWMFPRLAGKPDCASNTALLLKHPEEKPECWQARLWQAVQTVCPVPLHPSWEGLVEDFIGQDWIQEYKGFNVDAWYLQCPEKDIQPWITAAVQKGRLKLPTTH